MITEANLNLAKGPIRTLHISASKGWVSLKLNELWEYRELLYWRIAG